MIDWRGHRDGNDDGRKMALAIDVSGPFALGSLLGIAAVAILSSSMGP